MVLNHKFVAEYWRVFVPRATFEPHRGKAAGTPFKGGKLKGNCKQRILPTGSHVEVHRRFQGAGSHWVFLCPQHVLKFTLFDQHNFSIIVVIFRISDIVTKSIY